MKTLLTSGFAALSLVLIAGCTTKIDHSKVEEAIKSGIKEQIKDAQVKTMTCPAGVDAKAGAAFECKGEDADGTKLTVAVTLKDNDGNISWKLANAVAPPGSAAASAAAPAVTDSK